MNRNTSIVNIRHLLDHNKKQCDRYLKENFTAIPIMFNNKDPVIIFGVGIIGKQVTQTFLKKGFPIKVYADNNNLLWGKKFNNKKIISPKELKEKYFYYPIIISSVIHEREIYKQLKSAGFPYLYTLTYLNYLSPKVFNYRNYTEWYSSIFKNNNKKKIIKVNKILQDTKSKNILFDLIKFRLNYYYDIRMDSIYSKNKQYYDQDVIAFNESEIFLDGGAHDGDTIKKFCEVVNNRYSKIYAFEPEHDLFNILSNNIKQQNLKDIQLNNFGIYNKKGTLSFYISGGTSGVDVDEINNFSSYLMGPEEKIGSKKKVRISVVSIDEYFKDKIPPTFIKLDIEGSEIQALKGASKTIKKYQPKLAICVYHKATDLWEIPLLIKKLNNNYKIFLRHYSKELCETVCYAL